MLRQNNLVNGKLWPTSTGILNPKPGFVTNLDSLFFKPPFLAKKIVGCFWNALSFYVGCKQSSKPGKVSTQNCIQVNNKMTNHVHELKGHKFVQIEKNNKTLACSKYGVAKISYWLWLLMGVLWYSFNFQPNNFIIILCHSVDNTVKSKSIFLITISSCNYDWYNVWRHFVWNDN